MIRGIRSAFGSSINRNFTATTAKYLSMKSIEEGPVCNCSIAANKVKLYVLKPGILTKEEIADLQKEGRLCDKVKDLKSKWSSYNLTIRTEEVECQLYRVLKESLPLIESSEHIRADEELRIGSATDLSAFIAEEGKVNLSGEGGGIVGQKSYWEFVLPKLQLCREKQLEIISIGGAVGFDAEKTADVFKEEGLNVAKPTVVDPNGLAAYLGSLRGKVDHYPTTSEIYFSKFFTRQGNDLCIFHLGTTLNVLPESIAVKILEDLGKNSFSGDVISLLVVDEVQFTTGDEPKRHLKISEHVNDQGFAKVVYKENGEHYKTVIASPTKFQVFMDNLGFIGSIDKIKSRGVTFLCFRGLKR